MGDEVAEFPAAPDSRLGGLRARRQKAEKTLHLDLVVPRLDPPVYVRFRPLKQRELDAANEVGRKSNDPDRLVITNALVLTHACVGVFEVVGGKPRSILVDGTTDPATWPKFDAALAADLGLPEDTSAKDIVRGLFLADGDVISAAGELADWSAQAQRRLDEETEGN